MPNLITGFNWTRPDQNLLPDILGSIACTTSHAKSSGIGVYVYGQIKKGKYYK